jgi:Arc/MetJ-type ribon-helix-helix transcriptional regulator
MRHPYPPELQQLLHEGLASGQYQTEEEMILEAVRLLRDRDTELDQFKQALKTRLARLERGEGIEIEDDQALRSFFDDIQARGRRRYEAGSDTSGQGVL